MIVTNKLRRWVQMGLSMYGQQIRKIFEIDKNNLRLPSNLFDDCSKNPEKLAYGGAIIVQT